ncbi:hypothetical protein ABK040_000612 [Willaertia magna]
MNELGTPVLFRLSSEEEQSRRNLFPNSEKMVILGKCNKDLENIDTQQFINLGNTDNSFISHKHCSIVFDDLKRSFVLINHSKNGTWVNGTQKVQFEPYLLPNEKTIITLDKNDQSNTSFQFEVQSITQKN